MAYDDQVPSSPIKLALNPTYLSSLPHVVCVYHHDCPADQRVGRLQRMLGRYPAFTMRLVGYSRDAMIPAMAEGTAYFEDKQGRIPVPLIWRTVRDFEGLRRLQHRVLSRRSRRE